tara:strand:- start:714 stop:1301 length:588 start_codon:yes stop_codon:yes gene_type:complete
MTAITPLEFIHKKGLFGDHHKKKESDLVQISEVKGLSIIQVVKYKSSKIEIQNFKIDDLELPLQSSKVNSNKDTRIIWNAPGTWLIVSSKENISENIKEKCDKENFAVTDISHSRAIIQIKGSLAREVLKKGCPINLNNFEKNTAAGTVFHGITIVVDLISTNPDSFNLMCLRSFGETFYHHITDAALEFGYVGI